MNRLVALIFIFYSSFGFAQTWQKRIQNPFNLGGTEAYGIRIINDTIFVSSAMYVTDTIGNTRAVITKHDLNNGNLLQYNQFKVDTLQNSLFNLLSTGYDQLYDTGDEIIYLPIVSWNDGLDSVNDPLYLQIDKNLNVINEYPIDGFQGDVFSNFNGSRFDYDGNLLFYGQRTNGFQMSDVDSANTLIVKMTPVGEQIWKRKYDQSKQINFLTPLSDGDILFNAEFNQTTYLNIKLLIKANSDGQEMWRYRFGGVYTSAKSVTIENSEHKIIAANSWNHSSSSETGIGWVYKKWLQIQKIQDLGNDFIVEEDVKYVPTRNTQEVLGIEEMPDSNLLIWGYLQYTGGSTYDTINQIWDKPFTRGFLMMLDDNLDSLWFHTYYHPEEDPLQCYSEYRICDVAPLEQGGFVTGGWGNIHDSEYIEELWLMRLDEFGCIEPGCQNVHVSEIALGYENSMNVYPNPVATSCTIKWEIPNSSNIPYELSNSEIVITDTQGREVLRRSVANFGKTYQMQLDLTSLASGLYQIHWISGSTWLDTVPLLKQ